MIIRRYLENMLQMWANWSLKQQTKVYYRMLRRLDSWPDLRYGSDIPMLCLETKDATSVDWPRTNGCKGSVVGSIITAGFQTRHVSTIQTKV